MECSAMVFESMPDLHLTIRHLQISRSRLVTRRSYLNPVNPIVSVSPGSHTVISARYMLYQRNNTRLVPQPTSLLLRSSNKMSVRRDCPSQLPSIRDVFPEYLFNSESTRKQTERDLYPCTSSISPSEFGHTSAMSPLSSFPPSARPISETSEEARRGDGLRKLTVRHGPHDIVTPEVTPDHLCIPRDSEGHRCRLGVCAIRLTRRVTVARLFSLLRLRVPSHTRTTSTREEVLMWSMAPTLL
ncbi:hypothetical protein NEOLEDRAFT_565645 [Neolentinus lepideus HHB14362 ss-1]|uniref:Uncharacterized protein n=1 Tax=Neolentinus lepideus HHB14362 ss-1 TaxID=1314782 RepID=A0A165R3D5_9AGAM|nr:hypothetical protein NEOLEDRAFT_565645 [Neolentinus lepideus HHB14362 ss-1]